MSKPFDRKPRIIFAYAKTNRGKELVSIKNYCGK